MKPVKIGIIGGTGLDNPDIIEDREESTVITPFGKADVVQGTINGAECVSTSKSSFKLFSLFFSRHFRSYLHVMASLMQPVQVM